jgi:hypothetical protein
MDKIRLSLLSERSATTSMISDAENLKKLSSEKISDFLKWTATTNINKEPHSQEEMKKLCKLFQFKSVEELYSAYRCASLLFFNGAELNDAELEADLKNFGFKQGKVQLITKTLRLIWNQNQNFLEQERVEAIPILSSLRWRVDVRFASSEYLNKPEAIALLRIGTDDKTDQDYIYLELDEERLSWLESVIGKIKRAMLKTKEFAEKST